MKPDSPQPRGLLLILLGWFITVFGGVAGMLAYNREFDVAPFGILFMGHG